MKILGIESSCDETAAAVLDGDSLLSSVVASQVSVHGPFGGVVPELASREHIDNICRVVELALTEAGCSWDQLEGVAVTRGPGLTGALLVGLSYAKTLAYARGIPFVGVNHLEGHICSIFLDHPQAELPALSLVVSGGHTNLFLVREHADYQLLARTRDDAAGEALDKLSKFLGLGYPGGPVIDRLAPNGNPKAVRFTLPKISDGSNDFSFSGLKTAALHYLRENAIAPLESAEVEAIPQKVLDLLASYQKALIDQLLDRIEKALRTQSVESIQISGGVSCNSELRSRAHDFFRHRGLPVYFPRASLTTDNAAMIAAAARHRLRLHQSDPWNLSADPNLALGYSGYQAKKDSQRR